jgi:hypothetical protein
MIRSRNMSGFATVDEAFRFVSARPTILERLYESKKAESDRRKEETPADTSDGRGRVEA